LYGPGEQALSLTMEHGAQFDDQTTSIVMENERKKTLCRANGKKRISISPSNSLISFSLQRLCLSNANPKKGTLHLK
jgi:hypothetical protein